MKIYKVEYKEYNTEADIELAMDNIAVCDGKLKAWEYLDIKDDSNLICVESDSELPQTPDYQIEGLGYFERTSDNVYKSIFDIDSIEKLTPYFRGKNCDNDEFFEFENIRATKIGEEWHFERI